MRGFAIFGLGFVAELTACGDDLGGTCDDVWYLEGESGPGTFAFAPAMNGEDALADFEFADVFILLDDGAAHDFCVKLQCARHVRCPDGVFESLDDHFC